MNDELKNIIKKLPFDEILIDDEFVTFIVDREFDDDSDVISIKYKNNSSQDIDNLILLLQKIKKLNK